ncbi:laminarinase [Infundibulicybe gibba]|nr:laminarinase [Infundibulicybe gibba]
MLLTSFLVLALAGPALAATYAQTDSHTGTGFPKSFSYQAISDPTHGRVNYVNSATATSQNLTFASGDHFILRADFKTKLSASGPGRNSVRMQSNKQYTTSVMVFNIRHMPQGCGTWPAVWTVGADWPNQGEVDILEGVNDKGPNQSTLHTNAGCTMPGSRSQTGTSTGNNCDSAATNNAGCGVTMPDSRSYGPSFNSNGGGWYAVERTSSFIKVWFWSRNAAGIPSDVSGGATSVNTDNWGTPVAYFPSTSCPISSKFGPHNIVINLTFCANLLLVAAVVVDLSILFSGGDWAGNVYGSSGCPSSCVDYVNNNPSAFTDAYFDFAWLKIYG